MNWWRCVLQSDANKKDKKSVEIYQLMMDLLKEEELCVNNVRQAEREVHSILEDRAREEMVTELSVSIYDTQRNDQAKKHREMLVSISHQSHLLAVSDVVEYTKSESNKEAESSGSESKFSWSESESTRSECESKSSWS